MATTKATPHPEVATREEWRRHRLALLENEKALTRQKDRVSAERRRLPMVRLDKEYTFDGADGKTSLVDLFEGRMQLIVYHFMFDPEWERGCSGCTGFVNSLGDLSMLAARNTSFALVSRAPWPKLEAYKSEHGWRFTWVSSFDSDFNYDFHATLDERAAPVEYNYRSKAEHQQRMEQPHDFQGEAHGLSVFFRLDNGVYHTYSAYARGVEGLTDAYSLLDVTPYGRQEDWEDSPEGWPQKPTYG